MIFLVIIAYEKCDWKFRVDIFCYLFTSYNRQIDSYFVHFLYFLGISHELWAKLRVKMYKTKRPPMYKSTVKRVTYPKKFICDRRKWCYHFFHVKMRMILSFGERQKTAIQKCTNSFLGDGNVHNEVENVHLQLILALKKWTFTFFEPTNVHLHFSGSIFRYENEHLHFFRLTPECENELFSHLPANQPDSPASKSTENLG